MNATTRCQRCGDLCLASVESKSSARPFRRAARGLCTPCVVCAFFQDQNMDRGIGFALPDNFDPEGLRMAHIQQIFERVLAIGNSELPMDQIDWDGVIQKWSLPNPAASQDGGPRE